MVSFYNKRCIINCFSLGSIFKRNGENKKHREGESLILPSLANKNFNSLGNENDEPIYTYNYKYKRYFLRKAIKGNRCCALNQWYKSILTNEVYNNNSEELCVKGDVCEILNNYFEFKTKH